MKRKGIGNLDSKINPKKSRTEVQEVQEDQDLVSPEELLNFAEKYNHAKDYRPKNDFAPLSVFNRRFINNNKNQFSTGKKTGFIIVKSKPQEYCDNSSKKFDFNGNLSNVKLEPLDEIDQDLKDLSEVLGIEIQ